MQKLKTKIFWPSSKVKLWIDEFLRVLDREWRVLAHSFNSHYHINQTYAPVAVTVAAGTPAGGAELSNIITAFDGNVYEVAEVAATPGFNIELDFSNVLYFDNLTMRVAYDGSGAHYVGIDLYNYTTDAFVQVGLIQHSSTYYNWYNIRFPSHVDFVSAENTVKMRIYHYSGGNASHNIYLDYVALNLTSYDLRW